MTTADIRLLPVTKKDLPLLEDIATDPELAGELSWHGFVAPSALHRRYETDGYLAQDSGRLIVHAADGPAGFVSWLAVSHGPPPSRCWNIGIQLLPEHRGQGIGRSAQRLLAEYLFNTTTAVRVEAGTLVDNVAEQRALQHAGFQREGLLRSAQFIRGRWRDVLLYSQLRHEADLGPDDGLMRGDPRS